MAKIISLILLLITLFSCFFSLALCRSINTAAERSNLQINTASDSASAGKQEDWFHWGLVHPPIPAAGGFQWPPNRPWPHWEYVSPPKPAGSFQWPPQNWPHWHFVNPPMPAAGGFTWPPNRPWPHWGLVQPPIPAGSQWPPKNWPHWGFVHPPMPAEGSTPTAENGSKGTRVEPAV